MKKNVSAILRLIKPKKKIVGPLQVGIIGGSGLDDPEFLDDRREIYRETPYGKYFKI